MRSAMAGLAGLLLALLPGRAEAHPVDEVVQAAYLTLAPGAVRLELDITPGSNVAGALLHVLDANADRTIAAAEARGYARRVLRQSTLTLDGVAVSWTLNEVNVPSYQSFETGSGTISIHAVAERPDSPGPHVLSYRNDHHPAASLPMANVFLLPGEGWQYRVVSQQRTDDGREITVSYNVDRP